MENRTGIARVREDLLHMKQEEFYHALGISRSALQIYERGARVPAEIKVKIVKLAELRGLGTAAKRLLDFQPEKDDIKPNPSDPTFPFHVREDLAEILDSALPSQLKEKLAREIRRIYENGKVGGWIGPARKRGC